MWDVVYAWCLSTAAALDGVQRVYDGPWRQDPSEKKYAVVGGEEAGNYAQDTDTIDTLTAESGEVIVRLVSRSGDTDLAPHRVTTKAWADVFAAAVNADPTLGGQLRKGSTAHVGRVDVQQPQTSGGARVDRVISITYTTRL